MLYYQIRYYNISSERKYLRKNYKFASSNLTIWIIVDEMESFICYLHKIHNPWIRTTVPEDEAIRGHRSAHSLPTGPVIAEPFISPFGLTITPALSNLYIYVLESIWPIIYSQRTMYVQTFEIKKHSIFPTPWFSLAYDNSRHNYNTYYCVNNLPS